MKLQTNLTHLESKSDFENLLNDNENVMICCGRMGPMCIPVYGVMEELEKSGDYDNVKFADMLFDSPDASVIRNLPETSGFMGLPFTVYFKNGKVVNATSSIQQKDQIVEILDSEFK